MAAFHYHAVKQSEDDTSVTYGVTHDYIYHPDATVLFTLSKADKRMLSESFVADQQHPSQEQRSRLAGWLAYRIGKSLDAEGAVADEYWHTA
jgi:hypothetical protein